MKRLTIAFLTVSLLTAWATKPVKQTAVTYSDKTIKVPELFAEGIISTKWNSEFDICFSSDGKTAYFTRRIGNEKQKIYFTTFNENKWAEPKIAPFSTDRDEAPFITADGKTLYFGSQRTILNRQSKGGFDMNIWKTDWENGKWNEPVPLSEMINQVQVDKEEWPSSNETSMHTSDGVNFYFATMLRGTKIIEIYQTKQGNKEFTKPVKIDGLFDDDKYWKSTPVISPDGNYLIFNAYGTPFGNGGEDIYVSKKTGNGWTRAKNIGELINTKAEEASGRFSRDGKYFFFSREIKENQEKDGIWSIYYLESKYLQLDKLF